MLLALLTSNKIAAKGKTRASAQAGALRARRRVQKIDVVGLFKFLGTAFPPAITIGGDFEVIYASGVNAISWVVASLSHCGLWITAMSRIFIISVTPRIERPTIG